MRFDTHNSTPTQHLIACLIVIRGGEAKAEVVEADLAEWISQYGLPTRESVDVWAENSFELEFGIRLLINRPVAAT